MGPGQVTGPIPSADGQALQTIVRVNLGTQGTNRDTKAADAIRAITGSNASGLTSHLTGPLTSHITGPLGVSADLSKVFGGIDTTLLYSTLAVVIVILLITYRSPVLWLLPVISSVVALITAQAVIYLLAAHAGLTVTRSGTRPPGCICRIRRITTHGRTLWEYGPELDDMNAVITVGRPSWLA